MQPTQNAAENGPANSSNIVDYDKQCNDWFNSIHSYAQFDRTLYI